MDAKFFAIMADEVSSHCTEQLLLCVRFVDQEGRIREEFLAFILLKRVTGEAIFSAIIKTLEDCHPDISNLRGQTYDGASNMSSVNVGVQARIKEL